MNLQLPTKFLCLVLYKHCFLYLHFSPQLVFLLFTFLNFLILRRLKLNSLHRFNILQWFLFIELKVITSLLWNLDVMRIRSFSVIFHQLFRCFAVSCSQTHLQSYFNLVFTFCVFMCTGYILPECWEILESYETNILHFIEDVADT